MKLKINKKTIKKGLLGALRKLGKHLPLVLIFLICLDLILGGFFFWKYYIKGGEREIVMSPPLMINRGLLNNLSAKYAEKEKVSQIAEAKTYLDSFSGIVVVEQPAEPEE